MPEGHFACTAPGTTAECPRSQSCCPDGLCWNDCPAPGPDGAEAEAEAESEAESEAEGECAIHADCDDDDACTIDTCDDRSCTNAARTCPDDGIACTVETCDPATGCASTPSDVLCDDANPCTTDTCDAGTGCTRSGCDAFTCPGGGSYLVCPCSAPWTVARDACVGSGGCLVEINDAIENECIRDAVDDASSLSPWIGLHQPPGSPEPGGGWTWECGTSAFTNWSTDNPDDLVAGQDCAVLFTADGTWDDDECTLETRFVCEVP